MDWATIFSELAKASPYAILLVLDFILFFFMHRHSVKEIRKTSDKAIEEIRKAYEDAIKQLFKAISKNGERKWNT